MAAFEIGGTTAVVTGLPGNEAFTSIPPADRTGHQIVDLAVALRGLRREHRDGVDSWIVLSHRQRGAGAVRACPARCPSADDLSPPR